MNNYKTINVFLDEKKVGTLATAKNHVVAFFQTVCPMDGEDLKEYL